MKKILFIFLLFFILFQQSQAQQEVSCSKARAFLNKKSQRTSTSPGVLEQMNQYDVHYYKLDIAAERTYTPISGSTTIAAKVIKGPLSSFVFELCNDMPIDSLRFNGALLSFTRTDSFVTVTLPTALPAGSMFQSIIYYDGLPSAGTFTLPEPFHSQAVTCTVSEPFNAYHWFAVKQILNDKADSVEVWITTSEENKAGANGVLKNTVDLPNNKKRYEWKSTYPIAYYLISFAVAQYMDYTLYAHPAGAPQPIPIVNYIYDSPEALAFFQEGMDKTPGMIETFSDLFGLYPFYKEKYGHCLAPLGGGMENQTMTTLSEFIPGLTAHELAHQWFGDHVTCGTWRDIWLNEGFASYCEYLYHQTESESEALSWLNQAHTMAMYKSFGSVYVHDTTDGGTLFSSSLTYKKGALLLHMLRYEINNDALFFQGMKNYQQAFSFKTATQADFKQVLASTTGKNWDTFFNQWYFGSGYPILSATWNHEPNGSFYLQTSQIGSDPSITPVYETSLQILLTRSDAYDTLIRVFIDKATNGFVLPYVKGTVTAVTLDPNEWLLNKVDQIIYDPSLEITPIRNSVDLEEIRLFPNPASTQIELTTTENYTDTGKLYDARGIELQTFFLQGKSYTLQTTALKPGLYVIVLQKGNRILRFIKE